MILITSHIIWFTLALLAFIAGWLMTKFFYTKKIKILEQRAITDPVTGLYNYKEFNKRLLQEIAKSQRYKTDFALLLIDIDNFKKLNSELGYKNADIVMLKIINIIKNELRETDTLFRYRNGDEFAIIAPNTDLKGANTIKARIQKEILLQDFRIKETSIKSSISIGISCYSQDNKKVENSATSHLNMIKKSILINQIHISDCTQ